MEQELEYFLITPDWFLLFGTLLSSVDKFCRLMPEIEAFDADDVSWPGVITNSITITQLKAGIPNVGKGTEELPLVRRADLENHNLDGGRWVVIEDKVYDVQDFQ